MGIRGARHGCRRSRLPPPRLSQAGGVDPRGVVAPRTTAGALVHEQGGGSGPPTLHTRAWVQGMGATVPRHRPSRSLHHPAPPNHPSQRRTGRAARAPLPSPPPPPAPAAGPHVSRRSTSTPAVRPDGRPARLTTAAGHCGADASARGARARPETQTGRRTSGTQTGAPARGRRARACSCASGRGEKQRPSQPAQAKKKKKQRRGQGAAPPGVQPQAPTRTVQLASRPHAASTRKRARRVGAPRGDCRRVSRPLANVPSFRHESAHGAPTDGDRTPWRARQRTGCPILQNNSHISGTRAGARRRGRSARVFCRRAG